MKHIKYSERAVELIKSRMPNEFYSKLVDLYDRRSYTLEDLADHFNYSKRQMERISQKIRVMVEAMDDIVNGDVKEK